MTPEQYAEWPDGREDEHGNVWFACDPYPNWFRHGEDGRIIDAGYHGWDLHIRWRDELEEKGGLVLVDEFVHYRVYEDRCARSGGLGCGYAAAEHPLDCGFGMHDFVQGWRWVREDHPMLEGVI